MAGNARDLELLEVRDPDVDRCIQTGVAAKSFSAAACVASKGTRIFHRAVYGSPTSPPPLRKLGHDTLFDLASLTKPLGTTLAAMALVGRSRLDLNAPLPRTLPEFREERFAAVSVDMLLDHTSGWPAFRPFFEQLGREAAPGGGAESVLGTHAAEPSVRKMLAETPFERPPGSAAVYSDLNFLALGWILESCVGMRLDTYLERELYRPLGISEDLFFVRLDEPRLRQRLRRRVFAATEECPWREKLLQGEVHDPNAWALGGVAGHAGLFGTADAVWKLVATLWRCCVGQSDLVLSGIVRRFWNRSRRLRDTTRTLGWDTPSAHNSSAGKRFSRNSVGHLGFTGCSVWIDLSTDVIGVVLTNAIHPTAEGTKEVMAAFRPRLYDLIAKAGEALPEDTSRPTGAAAFHPGSVAGDPFRNPLRGPGR